MVLNYYTREWLGIYPNVNDQGISLACIVVLSMNMNKPVGPSASILLNKHRATFTPCLELEIE